MNSKTYPKGNKRRRNIQNGIACLQNLWRVFVFHCNGIYVPAAKQDAFRYAGRSAGVNDQGWSIRTPIVKVIASPAYRIPTRREFHLINLSDKAVVDVYLLFPAAIRAFYSFVHHDFLNQGV